MISNSLTVGSSTIILYGNRRNTRGVMGRTSDARFPSLIDAVQSFDQVHDGRKPVGLMSNHSTRTHTRSVFHFYA